MKRFLTASAALVAVLVSTPVCAKLPLPSEEAKAKSAEATAKSAYTGKVEAYQLCTSMDKVAAEYYATAKKAGTETKAPVATPPCADPGPFVYTPPAPPAAAAPTAAAAPATSTAPAAEAKR
jgi:hypothetical protein